MIDDCIQNGLGTCQHINPQRGTNGFIVPLGTHYLLGTKIVNEPDTSIAPPTARPSSPLRRILEALANDIEWCVAPEKLSGVRIDREKEEAAIDQAMRDITAMFDTQLDEYERGLKRIRENLHGN